MKKNKLIVALLLTIAYDYLFWDQNIGLNILVSFLLITPLLLFLNPEALKKRNVRTTLTGSLIAALLVLLYSSSIAKIFYLISFTIMVGFIHQPELQTVYNSFLTALFSLTKIFRNMIDLYNRSENSKFKKIFSHIPLLLFPFIILIIFYWIFKFANPVFDRLSNESWNALWNFTNNFFGSISILRCLFILVLLLLIMAVLFNRNLRYFTEIEIPLKNHFIRIRKPREKNKISTEGFSEIYLKFKNEYRIALIMTGLINLLLLIVNYIDIQWLWFNFDYAKAGNLAQFVHEGTYLLILSILISMGIILYFFRGNINFLKNNKLLKTLSYYWIVQNCILTFSVAIRNYHYIHQHGLAYKRIGVIVFLVLVLTGLVTLIIKISEKKSSFFLFRVNSWTLYFVLLLTSFFNWDMIIINNNVNYPNEVGIDKKFLLTLSDKTLFVLSQNKAFFPENDFVDGKIQPYSIYIDKRVADFRTRYSKKGWQSFNLAEKNCYDKLTYALQ